MGHAPTVFEKADRIGGLLRYGIPDFKMDRMLIDRRIAQMEAEGVIFRTSFEVGVTVGVDRILDDYDVMVLAGGAEWPRDLDIPNRGASNIHFAMDFLTQSNRRQAGLPIGLHRHLEPPGRGVGHPARDHARAAGQGEQAARLAALAA
jgi:glutamate synthase (NADPH/NADH) small chain